METELFKNAPQELKVFENAGFAILSVDGKRFENETSKMMMSQ